MTSLPQNPESTDLLHAALRGEQFDLPVRYDDLPDKPSRNEMLATRLAKNIGPLLGVPNPAGPFDRMSWLANYTNLTLEEIARGAPKPPPHTRADMYAADIIDNTGAIKDGRAFVPFERYIYGDTPNTIVAASLHAFGPDPKAAVTLTGINYLLRRQTRAVHEAMQNPDFQELSPAQKVQTYSAMIMSVYRPQPILVDTGIRVRNIQRFSVPQDFRLGPGINPDSQARCEIGAQQKRAPRQPFNLELIDNTTGVLTDALEADTAPMPRLRMFLYDGLIRVLSRVPLEQQYNEKTGQLTARGMANGQQVGRDYLARIPLPIE